MGAPQPAGACQESGAHSPSPLAEHQDLLREPDYQRGFGIDQLQDPEGQSDGARLPQSRTLSKRHLLPLRRTRPLSATSRARKTAMNQPTRFPEDPAMLAFYFDGMHWIETSRTGDLS